MISQLLASFQLSQENDDMHNEMLKANTFKLERTLRKKYASKQITNLVTRTMT